MQDEADENGSESRIWLRVYWGTSIFATLLFLLFHYVMMASPAGGSAPKLWMLSIDGALLAAPLSIGIREISTTEAAILAWPVGFWVVVLLCIEFAVCVIGIFAVTHAMWIA